MATTQEIDEGQYVFQRQQRTSYLLILLEGELRMEIQITGQTRSKELDENKGLGETAPLIPCGQAVGELSLLVDGPTLVQYRCQSRCRFLALPREEVMKL